MVDLLLQINKKLRLTKAKIQPSLMEIKLKVNIGKISKWLDNEKPKRGNDAQRARVYRWCDVCANYEATKVPFYSFSVVYLFPIYLFIYRGVPIFIHLSQSTYLYSLIADHGTASQSNFDYLLGTEQLSALNRKIEEQKDGRTGRQEWGNKNLIVREFSGPEHM